MYIIIIFILLYIIVCKHTLLNCVFLSCLYQGKPVAINYYQ